MKIKNSNIDFDVCISDDNMLAFLKIKAPIDFSKKTADDVEKLALSFLKERGISYGILEEDIGTLICSAQDSNFNLKDEKILCAMGDSVVSGSASEIVYVDDVDFSKADVININKDDMIAYVCESVSGVDGRDVFGTIIPFNSSKLIKLPKGENTYISKDNLSLHANIDGCIERKNGLINVMNEIIVSDDSYGLGKDIYAFASIIYKGDVTKGITIRSLKSIHVEGAVKGGTLLAKENIVVLNGVYGENQSEICADGNLSSPLFEKAHIYSGNDISANDILFCNAVSKHAITVQHSGKIVGGSCYASLQIIAKNIGDKLGTMTKVRVGNSRKIDRDTEFTVDLLHTKQTNLREQLAQLEEKMRLISTSLDDLTPDRKNLKAAFLEKSHASKRKLVEEIRAIDHLLSTRHLHAEKERLSMVHCTICCKEAIYPPTHLEIGADSLDIKNEMHNVRFYSGDGIEFMFYEK